MKTAFSSLTLALEGWYDTKLCDLPEALRLRVEREIFPIAWEELSGPSRRSLALQLDYQHDPAMEKDRSFWWDFFERKAVLLGEIARWQAIATTTASDAALRESRLSELELKLARMLNRERRESSEYYPAPSAAETGAEFPSTNRFEYVAYPKTLQQMIGRHGATAEELAAWVWIGPAEGGLAAYVNANELDPPPRFLYSLGDGTRDDQDYVSPLMSCWFRADEIARFEPSQRFITGSALIQRWATVPGLKVPAFVLAKIRESRLSDKHPIYGVTRGTFPDDATFPPLTDGLYALSEVETIEAEDFPVDWSSAGFSGSNSTPSSKRDRADGPQSDVTASVDADHSPADTVATSIGTQQDTKTDEAGVESPAVDAAQKAPNVEIGTSEWRTQLARRAANAKHDQPGGSRDKQRQLQAIWASGKYSSRDLCAEEECAALEMSYSAARRALKNSPDPSKP